MSWLINAPSQLSLDSKLTVYKGILRPVWTYGVELWWSSKPSNTKILQTFHSKMLRMISSAPWYVSNQTLHSDFNIQYVKEVVPINANKYKTRSTEHSNQLIRALFNPSADRQLKPLWPEDLDQQHNCNEPPMDGACPTTFSYLNITNYSNWVGCNLKYTIKKHLFTRLFLSKQTRHWRNIISCYFLLLNFWRWNYLFNFSTPCI